MNDHDNDSYFNDDISDEAHYIVTFIEWLSEFVNKGIEESIAARDLQLVEHGFCWTCQEEKQVYEVAPQFPVQPPICKSCLFKAAIDRYSNPNTLRDFIAKFKKPE